MRKLTIEFEVDEGKIKSMFLVKPQIKIKEYEDFKRGKYIGDYELMRYWKNFGNILGCELKDTEIICEKKEEE